MRVSLVCIAKNEDNYISEWVNYHKKLGFDKIFVYENDWKCSIDDDIIEKIEFNGKHQQIQAYNHFIQNYYSMYNWAAFLDVDEFLVLKKHKNVKDFINEYKEYNGIGINWVLFGDNGHKKVIDDEFGVIKRFTKRGIKVNPHIKTILNLSTFCQMAVHSPSNISIVDTNKRTISGPTNFDGDDNIAQINHYFCKTEDEFEIKSKRGRNGYGNERDISDFIVSNLNETNDFSAYEFMYVLNKK